MKKLFTIIMLLLTTMATAQTVRLDTIQAIPQTYIDVPVWVDFSDVKVGSLTLFVNYNIDTGTGDGSLYVLRFEEFKNVAPTMPSLHAMKVEGYDMIMITWVDLGNMSTSSLNGKLMDLVFFYAGGETDLIWNLTYSCLGDEGANYIQNVTYVNGYVSELDVTGVGVREMNKGVKMWMSNNCLNFNNVYEIIMYDVTGRIVLKETGNVMDVSHIKTGMYFVNVNGQVEKVIKY